MAKTWKQDRWLLKSGRYHKSAALVPLTSSGRWICVWSGSEAFAKGTFLRDSAMKCQRNMAWLGDTRGGFGKNSYNQLPWDAAGDDCSPASTLGSSGQSKHMKINWATIAYNRNQVKQKASTCKWFRSSVKYIWGLKHASVPKCGETCFAEPTTSLSKYSVGLSWLPVGRWPAYYFFKNRVYQLSHEIYMFAGVRSAAKVNNIGTFVDPFCTKYLFL